MFWFLEKKKSPVIMPDAHELNKPGERVLLDWMGTVCLHRHRARQQGGEQWEVWAKRVKTGVEELGCTESGSLHDEVGK